MVKRQVHGHTYDALRAGLLFSMYMMGHVFFCFDSQDIRLPFLFFFWIQIHCFVLCGFIAFDTIRAS